LSNIYSFWFDLGRKSNLYLYFFEDCDFQLPVKIKEIKEMKEEINGSK